MKFLKQIPAKIPIGLTTIFILLILMHQVSANDTIGSATDKFFNAIKTLTGIISGIILFLFPLKASLEIMEDSMFALFPFMKDMIWLAYLAIFLLIMAILEKLWEISKRLIINVIVGLILLLTITHVFGVDIQFSLMGMVVVMIFGVPGVLFVLLMHYLGIPF